MNEDPVLLVAASGLARETAEAAIASGRHVLGCLDDDESQWGQDVGPAGRVLGGLSEAARHPEAALVLCAGRGETRRSMLGRLLELGVAEARFTTVIHPSVEIPGSCSVGIGSILLAGTVLTASVKVGRHVVCMPHVTLTHDDVIGDFATLAASATLGGGVTVGESAYLGMDASVHPHRQVGAGATLGMGSVLLGDLPAGEVWAGVPAQPL